MNTATHFYALIGSTGLMPHGYCYLWRKDILSLHIISDLLIGLSYFSIPLALLVILKRRSDLKNVQHLFFLFIAFIISCGCTHLFQIYTIWQPEYLASGILKAFTALVSFATAIMLWPLIPKILAIPSRNILEQKNRELEKQVEDRIRAEDDLKAHQETLEHTVQQRTAELELANKQLTHSNQQLEQFAYVASHDLQEPLNTLMNYMNEIKEEYEGEFKGNIGHYFAFAMQSAERMNNLVHDLLSFAQIANRGNHQTLEDCDLSFIAKESIAMVTDSPMYHQLPVNISIGKLPTIYASPPLLKQLFQNFFTNALKYRRELPVKIDVFSQEAEDKWIIGIRDNGIGFKMEYKDKIFKIFQRLHTQNEYPGTGIGLGICSQIIDLYHGSVWAESAPNQGSTFYFSIPKKSTL